MDDRLESFQRSLERIEERNSRVEVDKAWETSFVRRGFIFCLTYVAAIMVFVSIGSERPFLDALIPALGYVLSTQSLPFLKAWWLKHRK